MAWTSTRPLSSSFMRLFVVTACDACSPSCCWRIAIASSARRSRTASDSAAAREESVPARWAYSSGLLRARPSRNRQSVSVLDALPRVAPLFTLAATLNAVMKVSVGEGMMSRSILRQLALLLCFTAPVAGAQGSVAGQVSLLERPGESSEDLADVIVWLDPVNPARSKMAPITTTVQLKSRQFNPRVQAVTEGSRIDFPNQDSFSHNVFSKAPEGAFDTG